METLRNFDVSLLAMSLNYDFLNKTESVARYGIWMTALIDSCFSTGTVDYNNITFVLKITIQQNAASRYC